ncbi:hypothetical protein [Streptosporangium sp. NPDC006007]|uniref:hypothetical protein n=1 Tax=Streptosporangium sp. NPDC006007 TaxID=3154575 RepID=UPI00339DC296
MSFFDRNIDAIETAISIVILGGVAVIVALCITGPAGMFMFVVIAVTSMAGLIFHAVQETKARWDEEDAEQEALWQEQRRVNRERELRRRIERRQQER